MGTWFKRMAIELAAALLLVGCARDETPAAAEGGTTESLSGTWDVIASRLGQSSFALTLTVDSEHVDVRDGKGVFTIQRDGTGFALTHVASDANRSVAITRNQAGSMVFGAIPLDLSGSWSARNTGSSDGLGCDGTLTANSATALCTGTRFPFWMGGYNPGSGTATATKEASAASIFGDLGGTWRLTFSGGGGCTVVFDQSTFASNCVSLGGATVTFAGSTLSGSTTSGYEFSAHRR